MRSFPYLKILLLGTLLVIMTFALTGCSTGINLNDYITVEFGGYNSVGTAEATFNYDLFRKEHGKDIKLKSGSSEKKISDMMGDLGLDTNGAICDAMIADCVSFSLDKSEALSNGEEIKLTWNVDTEKAKSLYNCNLKFKDAVFTVSDLETVETFDPFLQIDVKFTGLSTEGKASYDVLGRDSPVNYLNCSFDKSEGLKNGDEVTVSFEYRSNYYYGTPSEFAEHFGKIPSPMKKTFTVSGLESYVESLDQVKADTAGYQRIDKNLKDAITALSISDWGADISLTSSKMAGTYLVKTKEGVNARPHNYLYFVYKVSGKNTAANCSFNGYWFACFENVTIDDKNTLIVDFNNYAYPKLSSWGDDKFSYTDSENRSYTMAGFSTLEDFEKKHMLAKLKDYEYTVDKPKE